MHSGAAFSLRVISFDQKRPHKCGNELHYPEAVLVWGNAGEVTDGKQVGQRPPTAKEAESLGDRDPAHQVNYTRNIRLLAGGLKTETIAKIHPPLIIEFNGEKTCP